MRAPFVSSAASPPGGVSIASTHQCLDPNVEQLTYSRQPPSGRRISAGRSSEAQRNELADTRRHGLEMDRRRSTGRQRWRNRGPGRPAGAAGRPGGIPRRRRRRWARRPRIPCRVPGGSITTVGGPLDRARLIRSMSVTAPSIRILSRRVDSGALRKPPNGLSAMRSFDARCGYSGGSAAVSHGMIWSMSAQGVFLVCCREVDLVRVASAACCSPPDTPPLPCAGLSYRRADPAAGSSCRCDGCPACPQGSPCPQYSQTTEPSTVTPAADRRRTATGAARPARATARGCRAGRLRSGRPRSPGAPPAGRAGPVGAGSPRAAESSTSG